MIKFLDLEKVNNRFRDEIDARIKTILDKGWYLQGKENEKFSKDFAAFCGTKYVLDKHYNRKHGKNAYYGQKGITHGTKKIL